MSVCLLATVSACAVPLVRVVRAPLATPVVVRPPQAPLATKAAVESSDSGDTRMPAELPSRTETEEPGNKEAGSGEAQGPPFEALVDADACAAPVASARPALEPYDTFVEQALGLSGERGQVAAIRISPSFEPVRALSLLRRADGSHLLRLTTLTEDVWAQMMRELQATQGNSFSLAPHFQVAALARIRVSKVVREQRIDARTASLLGELARAVLARAQVVVPVGIVIGKFDGTVYELRQGAKAATTHSPSSGSVLGDVTLAVEHLERILNGNSIDARADLDATRDLLQSSLNRTRQKEPCLRRYTGP